MAKVLVNPRSVYTWDAKSLRYRAPNGAFVSQRAIKQSLNTFVRNVQTEIGRLASEVASGQMPVAEWQRQTANLIKSSHLASAAAAKGGWAQMTKADFGRVGNGLKIQYKHLRGFAKELRSMTPEAIVRRAGLYGMSAAGAYERARFESFNDLKVGKGVKVQMRNRLNKNAEHCHPRDGRPGCVEETQRGWVDLGELSLPGERACFSQCLCEVEYQIVKE